MSFTVWDCRLNKNTFNFGGSEWVVDGERGSDTFPGDWPEEKAILYYRHEWGHDHKEEIE